MKRYVLLIDGDFEKGECGKCPISCEEVLPLDYVRERLAKRLPLERGVFCPLEEVKQGEWIREEQFSYRCPVCNRGGSYFMELGLPYTNDEPVFCPNCGADMRGTK